MAFNVTYVSLLDRNIKHLYTTRQKTLHTFVPRKKLYRPEFLELELQANDRHEKRRQRKSNLNMEYLPEFNIDIPRAPAFRVADKSYVDEIVARLAKRSQIKANPRGCEHYQRGFRKYELEETQVDPYENVSSRKMHSILDRLTKPACCRRSHPSPRSKEEYLPHFTF